MVQIPLAFDPRPLPDGVHTGRAYGVVGGEVMRFGSGKKYLG